MARRHWIMYGRNPQKRRQYKNLTRNQQISNHRGTNSRHSSRLLHPTWRKPEKRRRWTNDWCTKISVLQVLSSFGNMKKSTGRWNCIHILWAQSTPYCWFTLIELDAYFLHMLHHHSRMTKLRWINLLCKPAGLLLKWKEYFITALEGLSIRLHYQQSTF